MKGLTSKEVKELTAKYGKNVLYNDKKENKIIKFLKIFLEPMFLFLIITSSIYFLLGQVSDGLVMLVSISFMVVIEIYQEWKTDKTLEALKDLSEPKIMVLRDGIKQEINSIDLVPGDIMYINDGIKIPADGVIIKCSGLMVDESSLTGESVGVWKSVENNSDDHWKDNYCYKSSLVIQGTATIKVEKIGLETEYGKIGKNITEIKNEKTLLQKQTDRLVKYCSFTALTFFVLVSLFTFLSLGDINIKTRLVESILGGVTIAMSLIPEEFPVILIVFLSMGAWRLAKKKSLVKKLPAVETLGAISVLCVDKTGTITKNKMEVEDIWTLQKNEEFIKSACLATSEDTNDPMEKAIFKYASKNNVLKEKLFQNPLIMEYPFNNDLKMAGNLFEIDKKLVLYVKGSPEKIVENSKLDKKIKNDLDKKIEELQDSGLRVLAVARYNFKSNEKIKDSLDDYQLEFLGLLSFVDPPRDNIKKDIELCQKAGVKVVMITGDNGITASNIAKDVGIKNYDKIITGKELDEMSDEDLASIVNDITIFSRVVPEHKMRIVKAFQKHNNVVAMTGDGVNDAPALKRADIGIAMGKRGSEVSREAADLILMDDNFTTIVDTIKDGRRIYDNIKKAVNYVIVIQTPIALIALLGPLLKIPLSSLMLFPVHIVLLELIIDPTCSVVLERQPAEGDIMDRKPRKIKDKLVNKNDLFKSILQGLIIFTGSFITYLSYLDKDPLLARTMGFLILIYSNLFLVIVNSSNYDYAYKTFLKLLKDKVVLIIGFIIIIATLIITYTPFSSITMLTGLGLKDFLLVILLSFISVFWYELIKVIKRH